MNSNTQRMMNEGGFRRDKNAIVFAKPTTAYKRPTEVQIESSRLKKKIELMNEDRDLREAIQEVWSE